MPPFGNGPAQQRILQVQSHFHLRGCFAHTLRAYGARACFICFRRAMPICTCHSQSSIEFAAARAKRANCRNSGCRPWCVRLPSLTDFSRVASSSSHFSRFFDRTSPPNDCCASTLPRCITRAFASSATTRRPTRALCSVHFCGAPRSFWACRRLQSSGGNSIGRTRNKCETEQRICDRSVHTYETKSCISLVCF